MTKVENVFGIFECYSYEQIQQQIQEARTYLKNGSEKFSKNVRPVDITESIMFLKKLDGLFTGLVHTGPMTYQLVYNKLPISLIFLYENMTDKQLEDYDIELKMLLVNMRMVLDQDNMAVYQNVAEFLETLSAILDSMRK